ncbi:XdhC family protein [Bacillus sp. CFBP9009]
MGYSFRPDDENNNERKDNDVSFIYMQKIIPKPRFIIFEAGCDVYPVVTMATSIGFLVTVCDWRPELCNENNIPDAVSHIIGFPTKIMEQLSFKKDDYVIIMTHNFQRDKEILSLSLMMNQSLSYIGILGSQKRTASLFDTKTPNNIHSPIGLSIGAKGPFEIAVSIIAELIQHKRMKGHPE